MKFWQIIAISIIFFSCEKRGNKKDAIARVNSVFLYKQDLENLVPLGTSKKDSISIVTDFINRWALQQLLLSKAEENITISQKKELDQLIDQYKKDLYTKAYIDQYVKTKVDTTVAENEIEEYYNKNRTNLLANESLYKLRYVNIEKKSVQFNEINSIFARFNKKDYQKLEQLKIYLKKYALNDSIWVDLNQVYENINVITPENKDKYLVSGKLSKIEDSTSVWLIKVKNLIPKNTIAPLLYYKSTIKQIILNNRKISLINKLEQEITNEAKKDHDFEIFK